MISLKVLGTAAAMALVLPMVAPTASFAQHPNGGKAGYAARGGGGGAPGVRMGGAPRGVAPQMGGAARFQGGGVAGPRYSGGGGVYRGGYGGGGYRRGGGGFIPGAVAGAVIGGAIASQRYYGGPAYYGSYGAYGGPAYYDDQYYDDGAVAVAPQGGGDDVAYCMQTYRSYDPRSGTYLGNDGYRHPCP